MAFNCFTERINGQILPYQSETSTCEVLKPTKDYSHTKKPSRKNLDKMVSKNGKEEILNYAVYLHNYLVPINIKYYDEYQKQATGQNYPKEKKIKEEQRAIAQDIILPLALEGDVRAMAFLVRRGYWSSEQLMNVLPKTPRKNSAEKFAAYQLIFNIKDPNTNGLKVLFKNKYTLAQDSLLTSYFRDFDKVDLIRVREKIHGKILELEELNKNFNFISERHNYEEVKAAAAQKLPKSIDDPTFCLSFGIAAEQIINNLKLRIVPNSFDSEVLNYDAVDFLKVLRGSIDFILCKEYPRSLWNLLHASNQGEMESKLILDYSKPEDQFFAKDSLNASEIFRELSGSLPYDTTIATIRKRSYYLNRAFDFGAKDAYYNLASYFQTLYYKTNKDCFNDSCIYYLEKVIPYNFSVALILKGFKIFNGEGYKQDKEEGVKLIKKAESMDPNGFAKTILESFPKKILAGATEDHNVSKKIKITYPWDFKVQCSNGCGKQTYPEKIIFNRTYKTDDIFPEIIKAQFFVDFAGNPYINFSEYDFRKTFGMGQIGDDKWTNVMCSEACTQAHYNKWNKNLNDKIEKQNAFENEEIKCVACSKVLKRKSMIRVKECPCEENGKAISINLTSLFDLDGEQAPRACSSECQINYCRTKCGAKGYRSKY